VDRTLSVLLPVCKAQATLRATVAEVLEVVSELTDRFEVVIVDDGSDEATTEIAHELSRSYPQVRAVCHGRARGRPAALQVALEHSRGETILIYDEAGDLGLDELTRHWRNAAAAQRLPEPRGRGIPAGAPSYTPRPRFRMADRRSLEQFAQCPRPKRPNYLARIKAFALGE